MRATADWSSYDGWHGERVVTGADDARALCDQIEADRPGSRLLVGLAADNGHFFAIGLGADDSCATYWESADPPYFQSRGTAADGQPIDYAYGGQPTELPGRMRIPRHAAFGALEEFMTTGRRPECIEWDET